ncbi:hypothetical protein NXF25_015082, partial [Crotalus adamanteus]
MPKALIPMSVSGIKKYTHPCALLFGLTTGMSFGKMVLFQAKSDDLLSASSSPYSGCCTAESFLCVHLKDLIVQKSWILPILIKCIVPMPVFILITQLMIHVCVLPLALSMVMFSKKRTDVI